MWAQRFPLLLLLFVLLGEGARASLPIDSTDAPADSALVAEYGPWDNRLRIFGGSFTILGEHRSFPLMGLDYHWASNALTSSGSPELGASMTIAILWVLPYADCGLHMQLWNASVGLSGGLAFSPFEGGDLFPMVRLHSAYSFNMYGVGLDLEGGAMMLPQEDASALYIIAGIAFR